MTETLAAYLLICSCALIGSGLTLFSGFGLGTLMTPVFALFFPIDLAIALTAIVHFLNNLFKLVLVGNKANKQVIIRFGIPSVIAALLGAWLLYKIGEMPALYSYTLNEKLFSVTPVKLTIAILLAFFSLFELIPLLKKIEVDKKYLPLGGLLSGFFGGLSGNQGALRSAFLIRAGLTKEAFIATGVILACLIDVSRLGIYSSQIYKTSNQLDYTLITCATLCAFTGAYVGSKLVKKVTIHALQFFVAIMLLVFSVLLGMGII
ncbi:MAG TPA: sulfite exporter TauE/SafE family protein [Flavobacteriales bacterium]|nr:sulfite exporter TauE/SafE family protein [Flavobacteriales bacterium]